MMKAGRKLRQQAIERTRERVEFFRRMQAAGHVIDESQLRHEYQILRTLERVDLQMKKQ